MKEATLLIYHMQDVRQKTLSRLCKAMDIRPVMVTDPESKVPLGLLLEGADPLNIAMEAGKRMARMPEADALSEEMIVMADFSKKQFSDFLTALREMSFPISLKAVMTEENRYWNGEMLQTELKKEREAFRNR